MATSTSPRKRCIRAALEQWPRDGVPSNPRAWLVSAGRFKAIDTLRRRKKFDALDDAGAGRTPYAGKLIGIFINMDTMVGGAFAEGLTNRKAIAEKS